MTDYIDATLKMPKYDPLAALTAAVEDISPCALSGLDTQDCGEQDAALLQSPNLRDRWQDAVNRARAAQSPIDRRIWTEHAISLTEMIVSPSVCACGVALNSLTKRCEACDERERMKEDRRAHIGVTERQRDAGVPF